MQQKSKPSKLGPSDAPTPPGEGGGALKVIVDKMFPLGPVIKTDRCTETKEELDIEWDCSHCLFDLCIEEKLISRGYFGHSSSSFAPHLTITTGEVDEVITRFTRAQHSS